MKINGTYKFKTQAIQDNFASLYIKVEFGGESKISHNDFASIVSRGLISDFSSLPQHVEGEELNPDLSTDVKVTLFASNGKGRVFYKREFPNYLQYSGISSGRLSVFSTAYGRPRGTAPTGFYRGNDYHYCLAGLKAYIEINEDGLFSIYGVINPNSYLDVFTDNLDDGLPLFRSFRYSSGQNSFIYYPILSFKDYEPLVQIGNLSYATWPENTGDPIPITGGTLVGNFFYTGAGVWTSFPSGIHVPPPIVNVIARYSLGFSSSFAHKYPNTNIYSTTGSPLTYRVGEWSESISVNYYIDINESHSFTFQHYPTINNTNNSDYLYPNYTPIIKDAKTGSLLSSKFNEGHNFSPEILKDGVLLPFDYTARSNEPFGTNFSSLPLGYRYWATEPTLFLYDDNIYTSKIVYNNEKNKWNITAEKNVSSYWHNNEYNAFDPFLVGKTAQESTLEHSGLDTEFTESSIEYSGTQIGLRSMGYSSETKTLWKYCNSAFIPESVAWEDKV